MSIKDLFNSYQSNQFKPTESELSASKLVESNEFIQNTFVEKFRYEPPIDFTTASNFAKFGSSELYYEYAFKRIYNQFPYDGSLAEKQEFHNNSTFLDKYIFENVYPRTTGHIIFSSDGWGSAASTADGYGLSNTSQYISVLGGPHTASGGMIGKKLANTFDNSMIYDTSKRRGGSFEYTPASGSTIEFWMKKSAFVTTLTTKEVVVDIWNQETSSSLSYGRIRLELTGAADGVGPIRLTMMSGATGFQNLDICPSTLTTASVADGNWHHYAVSILGTTPMAINLYQDGTFLKSTAFASSIGNIENVTGGVNAYIGALQTSPSGSSAVAYAGKLSASLDEFRYWKKQRTTNEIGEFWFINLGGGTNNREYNTDLGLYFKFNEGITTDATTDNSILDYSGRISNGTFVGYTSTARSTVSAMESTLTNVEEFKDPIIYSSHPTVSSSLATYKATGSLQDYENTSLLYNLFPSWIVEEDEQNGQNLRFLTQIMASYFDTLRAQINGITDFKAKRYFSGSAKPNTYAREVLRGQGFVMPDMLIEADILEEIRGKDDNETYNGDIQKLKNLIYQNIYNNLNYIYKSKGTEKSFRNFFRCFGVDSELIKLNLYSDDSTYLYRDNYEFTSIAKPVLNLNKEKQLTGSVYQSGSNGITFLSGSESSDEQYTAITLECEAIFPYKFERFETGYFPTAFTTASIAGFHRAKTGDATDFTWHSTDTTLRMYAIKPDVDSRNVTFKLSGAVGAAAVNLTSSMYTDVYYNNKWILAARVKHEDYPFAGNVTGSATGGNYIVEFFGVNSVANDVKNEFLVTQSVTNAVGIALLGHTKRLYAGAHMTNYTGLAVEKSDVKVSQVRFWQSHLNNDELKEHSFDPTNYGLIHPYRSDAVFEISGSEQVYVPQIETLALHWDFMTVTGSDSNGRFVVTDVSSGSAAETTKYSMIGKITKNRHDGYGIGFQTSSADAVDKEFIYAAKKRMPDEVYSSDGVTIKTDTTENFFQDDAVADHFYSFEKSPYNAVSQQMINFFGSMKDFNSLVGDPAERYRVDYKQLEDLKRLFFERVENTPDPEAFFEYFKWIDTSISFAISQLIPASAKFANEIKDVVESHILERNKYQEKFPLIARETATEGVIKSFAEISYNWKFGHAPIDGNENKNCLWQKIRNRISNTDVQALRDNIYKSSNIELDRLYDIKTSQTYLGNTDAIRRLSKPYKIDMELNQNIHGGTNYYVAKKRDYVLGVVKPHGPTNTLGTPVNVLVVGVGEGQGLTPETICQDDEGGLNKVKYNFDGINGEFSSNDVTIPLGDYLSYKFKTKGIQTFPFNIMSQSAAVATGYQSVVVEGFHETAYITNLHSDTIDITNVVPMQGPFTETHVGGHQSRHVAINKYDTDLYDHDNNAAPPNNIHNLYTRPEAWRLLFNENPQNPIVDGALGFTPPDYGYDSNSGIYPDTAKRRATFFREEKAKRPINVKNIRHNTSSNLVGNYNKKHEVFSSSGRKENNLYFRKNSDVSNYLPSTLTESLPHTTHIAGLFGANKDATEGNVFSGSSNYFTAEAKAMANPTPLLDSQKNESIITTRFSAPGGPEIQTPIFLDVYSREYSVHNALPFRNLTVKHDSGESGSIRVVDHLGDRRGLNTLLTQHSGRQGIEPEFAKRMMRLDGSDDVLHFSENIGTDWDSLIGSTGSGAMTFSFWMIMEDRFISNGTILEFRQSMSIRVLNNSTHPNTITFDASTTGTQGFWKIPADSFRANELVHIIITYNNSGSQYNPVIFVNGESVTVTTIQSPTSTFAAMGSQVGGWGGVGASIPLKGMLAETAIWNRILSAQEAKEVYNAGLVNSLTAVNYSVLTNLQLWYRMGENHDGIGKIFDRSGNGKHSIIVSGTTLSEMPKIVYRDDTKQSYNKQHRNTNYRLLSGSTVNIPILVEKHDNMFISTPVPASDFQYSWINNTLKTEFDIYSGQQNHYRYSPANGILSSSAGYVEAIVFPASSTIT